MPKAGYSRQQIFIVRLKFQKRSIFKFVSRTIPHSGGYNPPQLTLGFIPVIFPQHAFLTCRYFSARKTVSLSDYWIQQISHSPMILELIPP